MMNTERLLSFLGHTSTSDDFESFLLENDIKKMPKGDSTTRIKTKKTTLKNVSTTIIKTEKDNE